MRVVSRFELERVCLVTLTSRLLKRRPWLKRGLGGKVSGAFDCSSTQRKIPAHQLAPLFARLKTPSNTNGCLELEAVILA